MLPASRSFLVVAGLTAAFCAFVTTSPGLLWSQADTVTSGHSHKNNPNQQEIGPGLVRFIQARDGRWLELATLSNGGGSLMKNGGFLVFADDGEGQWVEIANTGRKGLRVSEFAPYPARCCEGMPRGFRAPSLDPDDDGDGRIDEDRLDGVDNDEDGAVDEDFAAIGDEMITTSYFVPEGQLAFHQEAYAWSLPHIDGAIMLSLHIRNVGTTALQNLHVIPYYAREGIFALSEKPLAIRSGADNSRVVEASGVVTRETRGRGRSLVLLAFPVTGVDRSAWGSGYSVSGGDLRRRITSNLTREGERMKSADTEKDKNDAETLVSDGATVFRVSPNLGALEPGSEIRVDIALVVAWSEVVNAACISALRTYVGDGTNFYVPPPVSMKPRVLWGEYEADTDEQHAVVINLQHVGEDPVSVGEISHVAGIDASLIELRETQPNAHELVLRGDVADEVLSTGGRVTLKGRLISGEFFEAILRPQEILVPRQTSMRQAEDYWLTPGELGRELLQGSPNPFRNATTVHYEIPSTTHQEDGSILQSTGPYETSVKVYNVRGRLVSILVDAHVWPGTYAKTWAAVDDHGNPVASGVYYVKLQIENRFITKRLTLLK